MYVAEGILVWVLLFTPPGEQEQVHGPYYDKVSCEVATKSRTFYAYKPHCKRVVVPVKSPIEPDQVKTRGVVM